MSVEIRPELLDHVTEDTILSFSGPQFHILKEQRLKIFSPPTCTATRLPITAALLGLLHVSAYQIVSSVQ